MRPLMEAPRKLMLMKAVIVGTAGHIDHGKSALVKDLDILDRGIAAALGLER